MISRAKYVLLTVILALFWSTAYVQAPDTLWTRTYGDPDRIDDCWEAVGTPDDGLAMVGTSTEQGYLSKLYVVRINSDGDTLWTRTYADGSVGRAICGSQDNGFVVSGYIVSGGQYPFALKIDSLGNEIWSRVYFEWLDGLFRSVQHVPNDGYILAGYYAYNPPLDFRFLIVRINSVGDTLWSRVYGDTAMELAWSVLPNSENGFIAAGWTESFGSGGSDFYVIKTDSNGDSIWARTYGDTGNDETREILESPDGGYIFSGKTTGISGYPDYCLMKIDAQGNPVWNQIYYGTSQYHRIIHSFTPSQNGGFTLLGYDFQQDIHVIRTDDAGDSLWSMSILDNPVINYKSRSIVQSQDGSYFLCGYNYSDIWVVKLAAEITSIDEENAVLPEQITLHQNFPNPFNASTTVSFSLSEPRDINLTVYDLLGRKVAVLLDGFTNAGTHHVDFNSDDYPSGVYFYRLKTENYSDTKMMVLLK